MPFQLKSRVSCVVVFILVCGLALAQDIDPESSPARNAAVRWLRTNNEFGPDSGIVRDMTEQIDDAVASGAEFTLSFGGDLMKSKAPMQINSWAGQFFAFKLNGEQAAKLDVDAKSVQVSTSKVKHTVVTPAPIKIADLKINKSDAQPGAQPFTGQLTVEKQGDLEDGNHAIRFAIRNGGQTIQMFHYPDGNFGEGKMKTVEVKFNAINDDSNSEPITGPKTVFVDVCTVKEVDGEVDIQVLSNSLGTIVNITEE